MGILDLLFGKLTTPKFNINEEVEQTSAEHKPAGALSHLDFGKPAGELGCFLNYCKYNVTCTDEQGKKKTRQRTGIDEQSAIDKVVADGYLPPYKAKPLEYYPPSEKQLDYLKDLGVFIPDGITTIDASCMISRALGEDSKDSPSASLVALAVGLKTEFSAFAGADGLFCEIINQASNRDRAALYAYSVRQIMRGSSFENMLEDPDLSVFYGFTDKVLNDKALLRSLNDRAPNDYKKPKRGTAIYKAAETYLINCGM